MDSLTSGKTLASRSTAHRSFQGRLRVLCAVVILALPAYATASPLTANSLDAQFGVQSYNLIGSARSTLPWEITGLNAMFSAAVVSGDINSLSGTGLSPSNFSGLGTQALTWGFSAALGDGAYSAALAGSGPDAIVDAGSNALNGGTGFAQGFTVLVGDVNGDGLVNGADLAGVIAAESEAYNIFADINGDGLVNSVDAALVRDAAASSTSSVPEPATIALVGIAGLAVAALSVSRRKPRTRI